MFVIDKKISYFYDKLRKFQSLFMMEFFSFSFDFIFDILILRIGKCEV